MNRVKLLGIIAIAAIMGLGMTACEEDDPWKDPEITDATTAGQLTITGLSKYNTYEIEARATQYDRPWLIAVGSAQNYYDPNDNISYGYNYVKAKVSSGQAILKVFEEKNDDDKDDYGVEGKDGGYINYAGNDKNVKFDITLVPASGDNVYGIVRVNFTNGIATVAFVINELDGTVWKGSETSEGETATYYDITFDDPNFTMTRTRGEDIQTVTGTYYISGNNVSLTPQDNGSTINGTLSGNTLSLTGGNNETMTFTKQ